LFQSLFIYGALEWFINFSTKQGKNKCETLKSSAIEINGFSFF